MNKFSNIKTLASYFSKCDAVSCATKSRCKITSDSHDDLDISPEKIYKLATIGRDRGFGANSRLIRVNLRNESGHLVRGIGFDFKFLKEAPYLYRIINHLDKSFNIIVDKNNKLSAIYNYNAKFPGIIKKAHFFIGGNKKWYANIDSPILELKSSIGPTSGEANTKDLSVAISIEFPLKFETAIHEIIHLKWPENHLFTEEDVEELTEKVIKNLKPMLESLKPRELKKLTKKSKQEWVRISKEFESFDKEIGRVLSIH